MQLTDIEEAFRTKGGIIGGVFLLIPQDAIDLVSSCRDRHIIVFGVEGFYFIDQQIQPSMQHSFYVSDGCEDCFGATIDFLRSHIRTELHFEVMVSIPRPSGV